MRVGWDKLAQASCPLGEAATRAPAHHATAQIHGGPALAANGSKWHRLFARACPTLRRTISAADRAHDGTCPAAGLECVASPPSWRPPMPRAKNRRQFLKTSAGIAAAIGLPIIIPSRVFGANEKLNIGVI